MKHLLALLALGLFCGADVPGDEVQKDKAKLQGTWKAVTVQEHGELKEDTQEHRLVFAGNQFRIKKGDETIVQGKFKIDSSKKPKEIDIEITEASKAKIKGKTALGIYGLEGQTLKWCANEPGSPERPKEFSGKAETKHLLVTLKREKP
jgi:uncharacterized protein (TIGR03067 family)